MGNKKAPVSPVNFVYVQMDAYNDEVKTESGVKLYKDTSYNPEWSTTVTAIALSTPLQVRTTSLDNEGIKEFVREGDKVIFRYMVVQQQTEVKPNVYTYNNQHLMNGEQWWKIDYAMLLGVVREGNLVPAPGYVFAKAIDTVKDDKIGSLYVPDMMKKETKKGRAVVEYVGEPKKNEPELLVTKGDVIVFPDGLAEKYEIEGEQFLVIRQEYVLAKEI